jgi:hypothetical protein
MFARRRISLAALIAAPSVTTLGAAQQVTPTAKCPPEGFGAVRGVLLDNAGKPLPDAIVYAVPECDITRKF